MNESILIEPERPAIQAPKRPGRRARIKPQVRAPRQARAEPAAEIYAPEIAPERPAMRQEDSRAAAERRAAEIFEHVGNDLGISTDEFYVDMNAIPPGWTYEWKRILTMGAENHSYEVQIAQTGWTPVPADRHPEMMPQGNFKTIDRKGLRLMERPAVVSQRARLIDKQAADEQMNNKRRQLMQAPDGHAPRDNKGTPMAKVSSSYEPMEIPKDR